eukprot:8138305-Alexandrium_andersonii.AAC.1
MFTSPAWKAAGDELRGDSVEALVVTVMLSTPSGAATRHQRRASPCARCLGSRLMITPSAIMHPGDVSAVLT